MACLKTQGKHIGRSSNLNDGLGISIKNAREQWISYLEVAKEINVGVPAIYQVMELT